MEFIKENWNNILSTYKQEHNINEVSFSNFIKPLEPVSIENDILTLLYNKEIVGDPSLAIGVLNSKHTSNLIKVIYEYTLKEYKINYVLPENQSTVIKNNEKPKKNNSLDNRLTFSNFIVGQSNRYAQTVALVVAETPGESYNPLFIYGGPGLGKTHLLHAIGNHVLEENNEKQVIYVPSETFLNEVVENLKNSSTASEKMSKLREKYINVDILLIDDIQNIIGKDATQNEFFTIFNELKRAGKQIVITADKPPKEMKDLDERFKTRFAQGIMADIGHPDYETRFAIILKKIEELNFSLDNDVIDYIANNITTSVREIEGAINTLHATSIFGKQEITLELAKTKLADFISQKNKDITPQLIIEVVAEHYNLTVDQMASKNRSSGVARPRQIAMFLCKEMTDSSLDAVGSLLGGRDHSTIIHGTKKIAEECASDESVKNQIENIRNKIKNNLR